VTASQLIDLLGPPDELYAAPNDDTVMVYFYGRGGGEPPASGVRIIANKYGLISHVGWNSREAILRDSARLVRIPLRD